jgi:hypothetical protein
LTSLLAGFVILDKRDRLGRAYGPALVTLAVLATVISAVLAVMTPAGSTTSMSDVRSIPLILMGTGLIARLTPPEVFFNAVISVAVFIASLIFAPSIPHGELPSLILMDAAIGAGAVLLNLQLETRDRRRPPTVSTAPSLPTATAACCWRCIRTASPALPTAAVSTRCWRKHGGLPKNKRIMSA